VRTYTVSFKPGEEAALHTHPDHVVVITTGGKIRFTEKDGQAKDVEFKAGEVVFAPAGTHSTKNVGRSTIKGYMVELKEAAPSAALSGGERAQLLDLYQRGLEETEALIARTPDELWAAKPAPDRWSVSEVVEHIALTEPQLLGLAQKALAEPANPEWASISGGFPVDALLARVQDRSRKATAPEPVQPKGGWSRADALTRFAGARAQTSELVRRTDGDLKKHVAATPLGNMTVHQILALIGAHNLRHNQQIAETLDQLQKK
jgi:uncharacterized damage-inducible protein DinB